ncbi:MAG: hypothetical protein GY858_09715 [Candidatus Omnitrophica bacterium]|nr:hypothetical protein [Candidatus Omnitrophota bacterium]
MLIIGFFLTGVVGHYLTIIYQDVSWERDKKYEVFKQEIEEAKRALEEVNLHISSRTYKLQKTHWALENGDLSNANKEYKQYVEEKDLWNQKVRIYRNKIKRLVDHDLAFKLLDSNNAVNIANKESVHAYFAIAHAKTRLWKRCLAEECSDKSEKQKTAHVALNELFKATDKFIDNSYTIFLGKYKNLKNSPNAQH